MKLHKLYFWLLSILSFVPLGAILGRTFYVQKNQNAYLSYSDKYYDEEIELTNYTQFNENVIYQATYHDYTTTTYTYTPWIKYDYISIDWVDYGASNSFNAIEFRIRTNDNFIQLRDTNSNTANLFNVWGSTLKNFSFNFISCDAFNNQPLANNVVFNTYVLTTGNLDNAFTYSIKEFNDIGFNKIQFVQWFTNMFTTSDNLYVVFINSYANYFLFVSTSMLLPYFIYWFVTLIISYMSRFTRKELR